LAALLPKEAAVVDAGGKQRGRCIEVTRIAVAVLRRLKIPARALACDTIVFNEAARALYDSGVPVEDWPSAAWSGGTMCSTPQQGPNLSEPHRVAGFGGHLVMAGDGWFADYTLQQYHRPARGVIITAAFCAEVVFGSCGARLELDHGGVVEWYWRPQVKSYRTTPAWRQDFPHATMVATAAAVAAAVEAHG
jgi:transglutaminase-like putative cysteine protease